LLTPSTHSHPSLQLAHTTAVIKKGFARQTSLAQGGVMIIPELAKLRSQG